MTNLKSEPSPNESFFGSPTDDITDFHFDDFDTESSAGKMRKPKKTSGGGRSGNRENHNRVERARRETLNGRFMVRLLPIPSLSAPSTRRLGSVFRASLLNILERPVLLIPPFFCILLVTGALGCLAFNGRSETTVQVDHR